jgi:hypothetical protein
MTPFDLPPDNFLDALRAELCRPAEVRERESYLSKRPDEHPHRPHPHYDDPREPRLVSQSATTLWESVSITPSTGALRFGS